MFFSSSLRRWVCRFIFLMLVIICGISLVPRSEITVHSQRQPVFDLAEFFNGKTVAYGIFEDRFGNLRRQFRVAIEGQLVGNKLILEEDFIYDDGEQDKRIWTIEKQIKNGQKHYIGSAADITGTASGKMAGNALNWRYDIVLEISGMALEVQFDDYIYQIDKDIAINRAYVRKWGVEIGHVTLVFLRNELAALKQPLNLQSWVE